MLGFDGWPGFLFVAVIVVLLVYDSDRSKSLMYGDD